MTTFRLSPNPTAATTASSMMDEHHHNKMKRQKKSSEDDLLVDNNKPKRKRISPEQFCLLTELFQQTDTPSHELRERLAKKLDMTNREVQVWFQNRRAKVNRTRLQEQEEQISNMMSKKVKFNYWSTMNTPTITTTTTTSSSSSSSSLTSSPSLLPHDLIFHPDVTPIDILATAAAYVQQWDEDEQQRKRKEQQQQQQQQQQVIIQQQEEVVQPKKKSWRPWL